MNKKGYLVIYIAAGIGLIFGIVFGMILQQMIITNSFIGIAEGLEGTTFNLEIDINETLMVDRSYEKMREFGMFDYLNETENKK